MTPPTATRRMGRKQERKWSDVVDELCECGHRKSAHAAEQFGTLVRRGSGECEADDCPCARFTWASFIYRRRSRQPERRS